MQINYHAGFESHSEALRQRNCRFFIGQMHTDSAIIVTMQNGNPQQENYTALATQIRTWAHELGFQAVGISDTDLSAAERGLLEWLALGFHGELDYMANHGTRRSRPAELVAGTMRVISARMNYLPPQAHDSWQVLAAGERAFISRYALGRDYHKVLRNRLAKLADKIRAEVAGAGGRVFTDTAPVMEVELARKAGLGWRGKHTLLLSREHGSWFFLGEIYLTLPLPVDAPQQDHCGTCSRCIEVCPTRAIIAPYRLDARRCISYLTIELKGSIPVELRPLIGNRIYGCDDCQLVCPWNGFAQATVEPDFAVRYGLDDVSLVELFAWDEAEFKTKLAGSSIYRIGYERWLRNIAVALGNAAKSTAVTTALKLRAKHESALVREHVEWALIQQAMTNG
jgi:epoxyqueuosine reductase